MRVGLLALLCALAVAVPGLSGPSLTLDPVGRPDIDPKLVAYWIWRDGEGYHLRATSGNRPRVFSGFVEVERDVTLLTGVSREGNDFLRAAGRRIEFRFKTAGNVDGFDFRTSMPVRATFYLKISGVEEKDLWAHIYLGRGRVRPTYFHFAVVPPPVGLDPDGRPRQYRAGEPRAYWIWREGSTYRLRATSKGERVVFSGWVEAGESLDIRRVGGIEKPTDFVVRDGRRIYFHLVVQGIEDGFDFRPPRSGPVTFYLMVNGGDGEDVLRRVFVGRDGDHPRSNPFRIGR